MPPAGLATRRTSRLDSPMQRAGWGWRPRNGLALKERSATGSRLQANPLPPTVSGGAPRSAPPVLRNRHPPGQIGAGSGGLVRSGRQTSTPIGALWAFALSAAIGCLVALGVFARLGRVGPRKRGLASPHSGSLVGPVM